MKSVADATQEVRKALAKATDGMSKEDTVEVYDGVMGHVDSLRSVIDPDDEVDFEDENEDK